MKMGSRLALCALAVQFILSFAHIHPDDIYGSVRAPFPAHAVTLATADQEHFASSDRSAPAADDLCAICVSISLLNSSFAAEPPELPPPAPRAVERGARDVAFVIAPERGPFQSRAPPSV